MARVTEAEVQAVLDTTLTSAQLTAFIDDASGWVDDFLVGKDGATSSRLKAVEKYLAAFFATAREPLLASARLDDVSESYLREENPYLELAIAHDPTGCVRDEFLEQEKGVPVRWKVGVYDPD